VYVVPKSTPTMYLCLVLAILSRCANLLSFQAMMRMIGNDEEVCGCLEVVE
jgi:hypothetical protein